jgi:hypothetical protein
MVELFQSRPRAFGAVLFGSAGTIFGMAFAAPWKPQPTPLLHSPAMAFAWVLLFAVLMAWFGSHLGPVYVRRASEGECARAAQSTAFALWAAAMIALALFCAGLALTGDFGSSLGVFGSLRPPYSTGQKLMAIAVSFFAGSVLLSLLAVAAGFVWGYLWALGFYKPRR